MSSYNNNDNNNNNQENAGDASGTHLGVINLPGALKDDPILLLV